MPKVFLCYAREDASTARRLFLALSKRGADVWIDSEQLTGGENWEDEIENAIRSSDHVVVLLSKHSLKKRGFVQRELKLALDARDWFPDEQRYLIPVRLDDTPITSPRLKKIQWIEAFAGWERALEMLTVTMQVRDAARALGITPRESRAPAGASMSGKGAMPPRLDAKERASTVKTTLHLSRDALEAVRSMAHDRGTTVADVVRRAIQLEEYFASVRESQGKVLVEGSDGRMLEILLR
jgi:hypothetical protein